MPKSSSMPGHQTLAAALILTTLLLGACATEFPGKDAELDAFEFPVAIALHPDGRYLYVVSANFNLKYRPQDGGTLMVVDLDTGEILEDATRVLGSFATDIVLSPDGSRGYIAVRSDATITWFAIDETGAAPDCPLSPGDRDLNDCRFDVPTEPTSLAVTRSSRTETLLDDAGNPLLDDNGEPRTVTQSFDLLAIAHLRDGLVSVATIGDAGPGQEPAFSIASAALVDGPNAIVHQEGERFFVTGRVATSVVGFRPALSTDARVQGLFIDTLLPVPTPFSSFQGRDLLFSDDLDRLYVTNQSPNSLLVFDTSVGDNDDASGRQNRIIAQVDMPRGPDSMAWVDTAEGRVIYVTAFDEDRVTVLDADTLTVIGDIGVGNGPFDLVIDQVHRQQAYVTNFAEHSISVLDISDPLNPVEVGVIAGDSVEDR